MKKTSGLEGHVEALQRLADLAPLLERLTSELAGSRSFVVDGRPVRFLTAEELSQFIPRSPETLLEWAARGVIPVIEIPGTGKERQAKLFDLIAVSRALAKYTTF